MAKVCPSCKETKVFSRNRCKPDGLATWCKDCTKADYRKKRDSRLASKRKHYRSNLEAYASRHRMYYTDTYVRRLLDAAKRRAKLKGLPFNLTAKDIEIPKLCPVLGIELAPGVRFSQPNSPSLDKVFPELGYVVGNVIVVSLKANQIKNVATLKELTAVYEFYKIRMAA